MARDGRDWWGRGPRGEVDDPRGRRDIGSQLPNWLLRGGLAFAFVYAATASFRQPTTFARYFPSFLPASWATGLLPVFAVFEVVLALSLLNPRLTYVASMLAALTLVGIVVANPDAFEVLFRNVALACTALALALQNRPTRPSPGGKGPEAAVAAASQD